MTSTPSQAKQQGCQRTIFKQDAVFRKDVGITTWPGRPFNPKVAAIIAYGFFAALTGPDLILAEEQQDKNIARDCTETFRTLELKQPAKESIATHAGPATGAVLAWVESYRLLGYVAMYEATGEVVYLEEAMGRFDEVLRIRDDKRNVTDEVRGRIVPAWSSTGYTKGKTYAWIVHAGMVTYPMARCAYLVRRDPNLQQRYGTKADGYVEAVKQTVGAFDSAWRENALKSEGWYHGDYLNRVLPFNQQNALGRTLVALWLATGKEDYRTRVVKMAHFIKNRLKQQDNRYVWSYQPNGEGAEDISHAAINVDFAFVCYQAGLVFTKDDMMKFAATLKACNRGEKGFADKVDGTGYGRSRSVQMGLWGHLGFVDREVRTILYEYLKNHWEVHPSDGMTSSAYLADPQTSFKLDEAVRKP